MKIYEGTRGESLVRVTVSEAGECIPLNPRFDLRNHSPDGFEWGYGGSGPAQLALAILADYFGDDRKAQELYQGFKERVVASLDQDSWTLSGFDIEAALTKEKPLEI